jgi:hypothetical protein
MEREIRNQYVALDGPFDGECYLRGEVPYDVTKTIPSVFDYVEYEWNEQSVWELFLLYISWQYMPLAWHANYARTDYIFDKSDLKRILTRWPLTVSVRIHREDGKIVRKEALPPGTLSKLGERVAAYLDDESILPKVTLLSDCEALVENCYWNKWRGLARERLIIKKEGNTTTFHPDEDFNRTPDKSTLVEYECLIRF